MSPNTFPGSRHVYKPVAAPPPVTQNRRVTDTRPHLAPVTAPAIGGARQRLVPGSGPAAVSLS